MQRAKDRSAIRKRKKLRGISLVFISALIIFSMLVLRVRLSARGIELAYDIDRLVDEKKSLEEENRKLALEIARLKSPDRISKIAVNDLKMVRSADAGVVMLER